jgi:RES domain-containing protein
MARRPRRRNKPPVTIGGFGEGELPSLTQLEQFSQQSLKKWRESAGALTELHTELFFGLELARQRYSTQLLEAVRANLTPGTPFQGWARIIDYRYCLAPLSVAGSLKGDGGRFNIGSGLNPAAFPAFPALYIASDYPTAFRERFGMDPNTSHGGLLSPTLALRSPASFTHVGLRGQIEIVMDISDLRRLHAFAGVLREFTLPDSVRRIARRLNMRAPPTMVRSAAGLQRQLLHRDWRTYPVQFDLPSNSQVFGRIAVAAGVHGILYPSTRQADGRCLALFPQNWKASSSFVEVTDAAPSGARLTRLDGTSPLFQ